MGWGQPLREMSRKPQPRIARGKPSSSQKNIPLEKPQEFEEIIPGREKQSIYDANKQTKNRVSQKPNLTQKSVVPVL